MESKSIGVRFVEAWGSIENPELDGTNPHFKNRYATLKATLGVIRAACKPLGLAYVQRLVYSETAGTFAIASSIEDGKETMELSLFPIENVPNAQAFGSEMTYKKRQQAQADWGIVGDEDEDGEAAAAAQAAKGTASATRGKTTARKSNGAAKQRFGKLTELKTQALELGITEEGMKGAIGNVIGVKGLTEATDTEIKACEAALSGLIRDKRELLGV